MTTKYVQMQNPKLQSAIDTSATQAIFTGFVDLAGNPLTQADFGTTGYGTLEPNTSREEAISFTIDSNPSGTATLTIVRGLQGKAPYGTGGTAHNHEAQSELAISNNPDLLNKLTAKDNDESITGSWKFPATPTHNQNPVPKKYLEDNAMMKTGDQTVAGVKTFSDNPVVPDATADDEPTSKGQVDTLDAQNVKLTGDQTVAGEKTFSTSPKVPDATAADEPYTKGQHDADATASSAVASPTVRGSAKLRDASATPSDPKVLSDGSAINESERSVDPADDAEKLVQLESDGRLHPNWIPTIPLDVQEFSADGTWAKPDRGTIALVEEWGAGSSGAAKSDTDGNNTSAGGGGGGQYRRFMVALADLDATESVVIGVGGAAVVSTTGNQQSGNSGGNTSFKGITALGGNGDSTLGENSATGASSTATPSFGEPGGEGGDASFTSAPTVPSTIFSGPGGGGATIGFAGNNPRVGTGAEATFGPSRGGDGAAANGDATAANGEKGGGGGAAASKTGTATSGKGGDGFVRVTVF